jgi:hypothetical protein
MWTEDVARACRLLLNPQHGPATSASLARWGRELYEFANVLLRATLPPVAIPDVFRLLCAARGHRFSQTRLQTLRSSDLVEPEVWRVALFIAECMLRMCLYDAVMTNNLYDAVMANKEETWRVPDLFTLLGDIETPDSLHIAFVGTLERDALQAAVSGGPLCASLGECRRLFEEFVYTRAEEAGARANEQRTRHPYDQASVVTFVDEEGADVDALWADAGKPSLAALNAMERDSSIRFAVALLRHRLLVAAAAGLDSVVLEELSGGMRARDWLASRFGIESTDGRMDVLYEELLRAVDHGWTPHDSLSSGVFDSSDRGGAESRRRPHFFALSCSRPGDAGGAATRCREYAQDSAQWEHHSPDQPSQTAIAVATLRYCVAQESDVELRGVYMFDDGEPYEAYARLSFDLQHMRPCARPVPRLFVTRGTEWWIVGRQPGLTPTPVTVSGPHTWDVAIERWCRRVLDDAGGVVARGKSARGVAESVTLCVARTGDHTAAPRTRNERIGVSLRAGEPTEL